jgi:hypothetical protein
MRPMLVNVTTPLRLLLFFDPLLRRDCDNSGHLLLHDLCEIGRNLLRGGWQRRQCQSGQNTGQHVPSPIQVPCWMRHVTLLLEKPKRLQTE